MTEQARQARNEYRRKWAKENREKIREYNNRYWNKRTAAREAQAAPAELELAPKAE